MSQGTQANLGTERNDNDSSHRTCLDHRMVGVLGFRRIGSAVPAGGDGVVPAALMAFAGLAVGTYCFLWLRIRSWDDLVRAKR